MSTIRDPLSRPAAALGERQRIVVVGSGYGGAVLAARLADAGHAVAVLERGREWHPGDFPTNELELVAAVRHEALNPLGLLDLHAHPASDVEVVSAAGLGGTSLINAAIAMRAEPLVFEQPEWPAALRAAHERGDLSRYYDRAEAMLETAPATVIEAFPKSQRHAAAIRARGGAHGTLRLNIVQGGGERRRNASGVEQRRCTNCGDCCSGCNVGAKNTLATNYLPFARQRGAALFTGVEVRALRRVGGGYELECRLHEGRSSGAPRTRFVTADAVVLAAGSAGSTELLLRSAARGLALSRRLGARFSANGDVLGIAYNGDAPTNVVARHNHPTAAPPVPPVGPIISVFADHRHGAGERTPLRDRFYLLEGAVPSALAPALAGGLATWALANFTRFTPAQLERVRRDLLRREFLPDGAINHSMIYLACGHDDSAGSYHLESEAGRVHVRWQDFQQAYFLRTIEAEMAWHARAHGAVFVPNPRTHLFGGARLQVTHPLGGCPMGDDPDHGVVDDCGRVFRLDGGVYEGLYVTDAAIIPRSLGATPLLSITALAERCADAMLRDLRGAAPS